MFRWWPKNQIVKAFSSVFGVHAEDVYYLLLLISVLLLDVLTIKFIFPHVTAYPNVIIRLVLLTALLYTFIRYVISFVRDEIKCWKNFRDAARRLKEKKAEGRT